MPKVIERYQRSTDVETPGGKKEVKRFEVIPTTILLIIILFILSVGSDTIKQISIMDETLVEQGKVCLAEFSRKNCDSLKLSDDCRRLFQCVQKENSTIVSRASLYL
jgi:hypothetical protein